MCVTRLFEKLGVHKFPRIKLKDTYTLERITITLYCYSFGMKIEPTNVIPHLSFAITFSFVNGNHTPQYLKFLSYHDPQKF